MLRLTEIKLPLDHAEDAIASAILKKLQIAPTELVRYTIFKCSYDARKKDAIVKRTNTAAVEIAITPIVKIKPICL